MNAEDRCTYSIKALSLSGHNIQVAASPSAMAEPCNGRYLAVNFCEPPNSGNELLVADAALSAKSTLQLSQPCLEALATRHVPLTEFPILIIAGHFIPVAIMRNRLWLQPELHSHMLRLISTNTPPKLDGCRELKA